MASYNWISFLTSNGEGCNFLYSAENEVHATHCVEMYLQLGLEEKRTNMLLELATQILKEPCFNVLRTQEQLGYIVFSGVRRAHGVQGLRFIVQSEKPRNKKKRLFIYEFKCFYFEC